MSSKEGGNDRFACARTISSVRITCRVYQSGRLTEEEILGRGSRRCGNNESLIRDVERPKKSLDPAIHPHVRQIAALHVEPLHLLVKPALFNYLNRLILHERDNLEDRAVTERRTAESVWNEALAGSNAGIPVPEDAVERPVLIESRVETSSH